MSQIASAIADSALAEADTYASARQWLAIGEWFGQAVGSIERLRELLRRSGDRWVKGMRNCRATFG
ncbi:MAG: hypothetical protein J5I93_22430 [Pirellulaceae bacterium]|nr:hypothetical protein [Pirellulaceae bacterium]